MNGISTVESAESGQWDEMNGINTADFAKSGQRDEMNGISTVESAESGQWDEMNGINTAEIAESRCLHKIATFERVPAFSRATVTQEIPAVHRSGLHEIEKVPDNVEEDWRGIRQAVDPAQVAFLECSELVVVTDQQITLQDGDG
ncbi:hypothetical protein D3C85_1311710 [compost metagenome]